jgi:hypothetical protein
MHKGLPFIADYRVLCYKTFIIKDLLTRRELVSKYCISSHLHLYIVRNMSGSGSSLLDLVLEGVELLLQKESGSG